MSHGGSLVATWGFLTNHALVLIYIGRQPESTGLEIAQAVGITERAMRRIVDDLEAAEYIEREKVGRRNRYRVDVHRPLARIGERELTVRHLLELVEDQEESDGLVQAHAAVKTPTLLSP
jgi:predicted ArsR family transcriptional regulator